MYCPHCDMDFVDGVTVCSDCGRKLITREEYEIQLQKQADEASEKARLEAEKQILSEQEAAEPADESSCIRKDRDAILRSTISEPSVYVSKAAAYEDNRSSAGAFFSVGGLVSIVMVLVYTKVITLPSAFDSILTKGMLTVIGIGFIAIGVISLKKAGELKKQAGEESKRNEELIKWFVDNYTSEVIDTQALSEVGKDAGDEELALARLSYIQDQLITSHDITDKTYADSLSEEIYSVIFEKNL